MSEARRKRKTPSTRASSDAAQLLSAIAESQRAAIALHENDDDDLIGAVGDFVLLFPDSRMRVVSNEFLRRACLVYFASKRFTPGLSAPQISGADIPRAKKLIAAMRDELRTRNDESKVIPPKNWRSLLQRDRAHEHA